MKIPIFKLQYEEHFINEYLSRSRELFESGFISEGLYARKWEKEFSDFQNVAHSLCVSSCTSGLEAILKTIDVRGKKVILPSNTYFATATAIESAGGIPVFVDCDFHHLGICIEHLEYLLTLDEYAAIIIVFVGGIIQENIEAIKILCEKNNVPLVEDAAHAHGSYLSEEIRAGSIGIAASFSFFPTKVMTTGEGGMITSSDEKFLKSTVLKKNFGADPDHEKTCVTDQGSNYRISEFTALLGVLETRRAKIRIQRRNDLALRYIQNLSHSDYEPIIQQSGRCSFYKLILKTEKIRVHSASDIELSMRNKSIAMTGRVYQKPVHRQPYFKHKYSLLDEHLPKTSFISDNHICPPLYPELTETEVDYICENLLGYLRS